MTGRTDQDHVTNDGVMNSAVFMGILVIGHSGTRLLVDTHTVGHCRGLLKYYFIRQYCSITKYLISTHVIIQRVFFNSKHVIISGISTSINIKIR